MENCKGTFTSIFDYCIYRLNYRFKQFFLILSLVFLFLFHGGLFSIYILALSF